MTSKKDKFSASDAEVLELIGFDAGALSRRSLTAKVGEKPKEPDPKEEPWWAPPPATEAN